jgi:hypothetical protein
LREDRGRPHGGDDCLRGKITLEIVGDDLRALRTSDGCRDEQRAKYAWQPARDAHGQQFL